MAEPLWRRYLRFFGPDPAADADDEIRYHLDRLTEDFRSRGLGEREAQEAARARFGDPVAVRRALQTAGSRRVRRERRAEWLAALGQDFHHALRRLRRERGFTFAVVSVLALGIGAATAMFSAVDAALFRPLPFASPDRLVVLRHVNVPFRAEDFRPSGGDGADEAPRPVRFVEITDVAELSGVFSHVAAYAVGGLNLDDPDRPLRVRAGVVSADFFGTLGVPPALGRTWLPDDGTPDAAPVVILSDGLWRRQFGGGAVLGRDLRLNGRAYRIVGVMPRGFGFPEGSDLWIPLSVPIIPATFEPFRGWLPSTVVARIAAGVSRETAAARLMTLWQRRAADARVPGKRSNLEVTVDELRRLGALTPLQQTLTGDQRRALLILLGATGLLLLLACANVTNLLLAHAATRRREIAVRAVLGATRGRVTRQLLTESVVLAGLGGVCGLGVARLVLELVRLLLPPALVTVSPPHLDLRVLAFATAVALLTGLGFGAWPAIGAGRTDVGETIKTGGGWGTTARGARRVRRALVSLELGVALTLLVGAALMLHSLQRVLAAGAGLDPHSVATLQLGYAGSIPTAARMQRIEDVLQRLTAVPGIEAAGVVNDLPLEGQAGIALLIQAPGRPALPGAEPLFARYLIASGGYFRALGIPLLRGRVFDAADDSSAKVVIVNDSLARLLWAGVDPIGRPLHSVWESPYTVIGVVGDVKDASLERPPPPQMYFPVRAMTPQTLSIVVRGTLPADALLRRLREAVRQVDPAQAVYNVRMMSDVLGTSLRPRRTNTLLIVLFGALALVLAALGVYAVVRHGMAQRTRELGIRSALGATGGDLVALVAREMLGATVAGLAAGLLGAWALARVLASQLYEVKIGDGASFALAAAVLLAAAALATLLPARRALRLDPIDVIRTE
ncbi:MAG TPA: ADOP family duplicated permease [Gemmatimonadales bacterium]|nr:ADOP family duplicated permease [Gemmatimonadales bacterium]